PKQFLDSDQLKRVSCLIVDGKMPGMSGHVLHRQLVTAGLQIPTILITGRPTAGGRKRALAAGMVSYLSKPVSEESLLDQLCLALARGAAPAHAAGARTHIDASNDS